MQRIARAAFLLLASCLTWGAQAQTCTNVGTGNWGTAGTWNCTLPAGARVPTNADNVVIINNSTVTVNIAGAVAGSVTINGGANATSLALGVAGTSLTVTNAGGRSGNVIINAPTANVTKQLAVGARTLAVTGSVTINGGTAGGGAANISQLSVTTSPGTANIGGNLIINAGTVNTSVAQATVTTGTINVTGNATLTGGGTNSRDALLSVTGASAVGAGVNIDGTLNINSTVAGSSTASTGTGSRITVNGAGGVNNGDSVVVNAGIFSVTNAAATFTNSNAAVVATTTVSTGTLSITGALTNATAETMTVSSTGNITVDGVLTNSGTMTLTTTGIVNANGGLTNNGTFTNTAAGQLFLRGATSTVNGTFNRGTGTVTLNGGAAQNLLGTAVTGPAVAASLYNLTINNSNGVTLGNNVRAANTITFTNGNVTTGTNSLISGLSCANVANVSRTSGHVVGNFQKTIPAAISSCTFEVGSGSNYTPVVLGFAAAPTVAGSITASTTGTEHGSIASSGIDSTKSVNRYWTLTNVGVTPAAAGFTATFNYINGSPVDYDSIGTPANFIVERWNGTSWFPTTLNATCTATPGTNLCEQVNGLTAAMFGDFAIGEQVAEFNGNPGAFNVFETTTPVGVLGRLFTKRVGAGTFAVSIVAVSNNAVNTSPATTALTVDVIDASPTGGTLTTASNCRTTWTTVIQTQTVPAAVAWVSGRINVNITAPTQAVRNARIRVTQGGSVGCSTDNFTIRPQAFTVTSTNATQNGTSGIPAIKTGANFNLTAASVAGYDGVPALDNTKVAGTPAAGTIGGTFTAAPVGTGTASGSSFFYSETGNFGLNADAVRDTGFTSVDQGTSPNDDCIASSTSNTLSGGKYGCWVGSTAVAQTTGSSGFGRFIPDNFNVSYGTPAFATACTGFGYVGQSFTYTTVPVLTVTARAGTNNGLTNQTTTNYAGSYMKFTNASLAQTTYATQAGRYTRFDVLGGGNTPALDVSGLPATTADPAIGTFTSGVGAFTFAGGSGLAFTRSTTTPSAPFDADIALALNVIDTDGVTFASNPASFGAATAGNGITFSDGNAGTTTDKLMRYGRLRLGSASGSSLLPLRVPVEAQYWSGAFFVTNANDDCTTLASTNVGLGNTIGGIVTSVTAVTSPLQKGRGAVTLAKPTGGTSGSVDVAVNLGPVPPGTGTADACPYPPATPFTPAATAANKAYLRGLWCVPAVPPGTYTKDPATRARFGVMRGGDEAIHARENTN